MHVVIAGATGFLGTHLAQHLRAHGHQVTALVRRPAAAGESRWDPYSGDVDAALIHGCDAVVNLAGESIAGNPHSRRWARAVLDSRVATTSLLATTIATADRPPALVAGSAIAYYGDHGASPLSEDSTSLGDTFLTRVVREWEAAAEPAAGAGARVCTLRTAPVLDRASSPLSQLRRLFRCGLGARVGDGSQYFPVMSLRDWVSAATYLLESDDVAGEFNMCCPTTPTNAEFTSALARAVGRRSFLAVPAPALRLAAGPMAPELLGSVNARPTALQRAGYDFFDEEVGEVLAAALA